MTRRYFLHTLAFVAAALVAGLPAAGTAATNAGTGPILVLGDSLSAEYGLKRGSGWVALLDQRLREQKLAREIINASISGETSAGGRSRIADLLGRHHPSLVVVELGGNDALRGLDLTVTERNLREIIAMARASGARTLLIGIQVPPNYGRAYTDRFSAMFRSVADAEKTPLVPFFLDGVADRIDMFQGDRIHPTEAAQPRLLDNVWPQLQPLLAGRTTK